MKQKWMISIVLLIIFISGCSDDIIYKSDSSPSSQHDIVLKEKIETYNLKEDFNFNDFNGTPTQWGENVTGVKTKISTAKKEIALTFDACGGEYGSEVDYDLIDFLKKEHIPATLFVNQRWITENELLFLDLATNPLFEIENHGTDHAPLSVDGGEAWGIKATDSPEEVYDEIMENHDKVKDLTGLDMKYFRSGTAFYDEIAVEIATRLDYQIVNFDILGDAGATYSSDQVKNALLSAENGSIALLHMNQPNSGTAKGVQKAVPLLEERGFTFILLENNILE